MSYYNTVGVFNEGLVKADFDVDISMLGIYIFGALIKKKESPYKEESQTKFQFYHFKPSLS